MQSDALFFQNILQDVLFFVKAVLENFLTILGQMAHNVPAVCDGLAARIRALRSKDQGRQTVPEQRRGSGA
jgi:hypothetical protein